MTGVRRPQREPVFADVSETAVFKGLVLHWGGRFHPWPKL